MIVSLKDGTKHEYIKLVQLLSGDLDLCISNCTAASNYTVIQVIQAHLLSHNCPCPSRYRSEDRKVRAAKHTDLADNLLCAFSGLTGRLTSQYSNAAEGAILSWS